MRIFCKVKFERTLGHLQIISGNFFLKFDAYILVSKKNLSLSNNYINKCLKHHKSNLQ